MLPIRIQSMILSSEFQLFGLNKGFVARNSVWIFSSIHNQLEKGPTKTRQTNQTNLK